MKNLDKKIIVAAVIATTLTGTALVSADDTVSADNNMRGGR
jgi:hypothetical protein